MFVVVEAAAATCDSVVATEVRDALGFIKGGLPGFSAPFSVVTVVSVVLRAPLLDESFGFENTLDPVVDAVSLTLVESFAVVVAALLPA